MFAPVKRRLVGLDMVDEIILTAIQTGQVANSVPISALLISVPGAGKSKTVLKFHSPAIHRTDDFTSMGLFHLLEADKENKISHIVLGDFNAPLSHKASTTDLTIASLLSVMSDGTMRVDDGRQSKVVQHRPCGIISAVTEKMFLKYVKKWEAIGFMRRFLPICYNYSVQTRRMVQDAIRDGKVTLEQLTPITLKPFKQPQEVAISPAEAQQIEGLSKSLAGNLAWRPVKQVEKTEEGRKVMVRMAPDKPPLEFTPHLILQAMARGHALMRGRRKVEKQDVEFLEVMIDFANIAEPRLI